LTRPWHGGTLPNELSSFVGGQDRIAAVATRLSEARLVTLTGVGGVGKTRLALRAARAARTDYASCSWITLSPAMDGARISDLIAATLSGGQRAASTTVERLVSCIGDQRLLLVLDTCEHLIDACADLVSRVLHDCAGVRILATSREPLGVPGEVIFAVEPLSVPDQDEPLDRQMQSEAAQLFLTRARARKPDLLLTDEGRRSVASICRSLNGIPLALELAAAWTSSMTLPELVARVDNSLALLTAGPRTVPPRQQSLRASLDWSHAQLQIPEQLLLRRLAVLSSEFTLEDAEAVGAFQDLEVADIAFLLDRLVTSSMVQARERESRMRFSLPALVREYALERLEVAGELDHAREALVAGPANCAGREPAPDVDVGADDASDLPIRHLQATPPRARIRRPSALSDRERDVVVLIAEGRSNREIADELVITKKTAEAHVSHILTKLGLQSRVQIATWSLQHGIVHAPSLAQTYDQVRRAV